MPAAGDVAGALHDASEVLRLSGSLFGVLTDAAPAGASADAPTAPEGLGTPARAAAVREAGWWRAVADYLGSLLQAGELAEAAGAPDDAAAAFREGRRLVQPEAPGKPTTRYIASMLPIQCVYTGSCSPLRHVSRG